MARPTENQARLLLDPNLAVVATVRPDGSPQASVALIDWDGESAAFATRRERAEVRHVERDPRVGVTVFDRQDP